jgi:hypothetical protein
MLTKNGQNVFVLKIYHLATLIASCIHQNRPAIVTFASRHHDRLIDLLQLIPIVGLFLRFKCMVARWFIFKPKIPIWVNFGGP